MYSVYMYVANVIEYIHCTSHVHDLYIQSILRLRPSVVSDHLSSATSFPKYQLKIFRVKSPPLVSHHNHLYLELKVGNFPLFVSFKSRQLPYSNEEKFWPIMVYSVSSCWRPPPIYALIGGWTVYYIPLEGIKYTCTCTLEITNVRINFVKRRMPACLTPTWQASKGRGKGKRTSMPHLHCKYSNVRVFLSWTENAWLLYKHICPLIWKLNSRADIELQVTLLQSQV